VDPTALVVDIVETLETCGLDRDAYQLYDYIDVEALAQLLDSSSGNVDVEFTVEEVRLAVAPDGIDVLDTEEAATADES